MPHYDVIVLGLGAFGSAAAYNLARGGASVLGIDRFDPPHRHGSTHGETRITRAAIGEGVDYAPLALRSHVLWRRIEREMKALTGTRPNLFVQCGCLSIVGPGETALHGVSDFFPNIEAAARRYDIPGVAYASGAEIARAYPQFHTAPEDRGFLDRAGGYLFVEECVAAQLALARAHKARLLTNTKVTAFRSSATRVTVETEAGKRFTADQLLLTAGAWLPGFLPEALRPIFTVTRQVLYWFEIKRRPELYTPDRMPVFIWDGRNQSARRGPHRMGSLIYGFPLTGGPEAGLKVTHEEPGPIVNPDRVPRRVSAEETAHTSRAYLKRLMPDLGARAVRTATCLYTNVAGGRFVIDRHPEHPRVVFASPCSGHGFKHSAAVGEALADQLAGRRGKVDLRGFELWKLTS